MVRIDRRSGKPVFGAWPSDDPLSPVIWEAFKPESEPSRAIKRDETVAEKPKEAARVDQSRDSDFLHREAGIYLGRPTFSSVGLPMAPFLAFGAHREEARLVGGEMVRTCSSWWWGESKK